MMMGYGIVMNAIGDAVLSALNETYRQLGFNSKTVSWLKYDFRWIFMNLDQLYPSSNMNLLSLILKFNKITKIYHHSFVNNNSFALSNVGFSDPSV